MCNIFAWKIEKLLNAVFLLSNNTLHVMFYTYICYWNTFQYMYIQITFHVTVKLPSLSISQFTLRGWFFPLNLSQKLITWEKCVT